MWLRQSFLTHSAQAKLSLTPPPILVDLPGVSYICILTKNKCKTVELGDQLNLSFFNIRCLIRTPNSSYDRPLLPGSMFGLVYWSGFLLLWTIWKTLYWIWYIFLPTSFRGQRLLIRWQTVSEWQGIINHCDKITEKKLKVKRYKKKIGVLPHFPND